MEAFLFSFSKFFWQIGDIASLLIFFIFMLVCLFGQSFIKGLGEKYAELILSKQKTIIEEKIKRKSASILAEFEATLQKKNIAFEVEYSFFFVERSKSCLKLYKQLESFYNNAYILTCHYIKPNYYPKDQYDKEKNEYNQSYENLRFILRETKVFLPEDLERKVDFFSFEIQTNCCDYMLQVEKLNSKETTSKIKTKIEQEATKIDLEEKTKSTDDSIFDKIKNNIKSQLQELNEIEKSLKLLIQPKLN